MVTMKAPLFEDRLTFRVYHILLVCTTTQILMGKPLVIIVNGLPGTGKTTLAKRLPADAQLPVLHRDGMYEKLYDALACQTHGRPPLLGPATFTILHYVTGSLLAAGQSITVEGFFGLS